MERKQSEFIPKTLILSFNSAIRLMIWLYGAGSSLYAPQVKRAVPVSEICF